jgi:hypothetical protein
MRECEDFMSVEGVKTLKIAALQNKVKLLKGAGCYSFSITHCSGCSFLRAMATT